MKGAAMPPFRERPLEVEGMPPGVPFIVANEAAERFSFYGMRAILVVFMTQHLVDAAGRAAPMQEGEARASFHLFASAVYLFPIVGALVADAFFGKYRTILWLSLVYCAGHLALALDETRSGLALGLTLIAVGSGGIKPCVSAHVGDQFGERNAKLLSRVFMMFYWSINLGAFSSKLATPWLLEVKGPSWAFGVPGVLMGLATLFFWLGRRRFVHVPPAGGRFLKQVRNLVSAKELASLGVVYLFVAAFWALFDQMGSAWVLQARNMDTTLLGWKLLPSQVQSVNPILILCFIPLFSYVIYPTLQRFFLVTPLRKILMGFALAVPAFLIPAYVEARIGSGEQPSIVWHLAGYTLMTAAEVLISITCLEYSYTKAPASLKSVVMSLYLLSISLGNAFTWLVNVALLREDGSSRLEGSSYYLFFAAIMALATFAFVPTVFRTERRERQELERRDKERRERQELERGETRPLPQTT